LAVRRPAVAGAFYAASPENLEKQIIECFKHPLGPGRLPQGLKERKTLAVVCPHAGYMYSGPAAAHSYLVLGEQKPPETVVVIGPNHSGWGTPLSVMAEGSWRTPLGDVAIDSELAWKIIELSETAQSDETAFIREHSLEVQLPFLQYIYPEFKIVPICMGKQDLEVSRELGQAIYQASKNKEIIIVASSDLNHQEPKTVSNIKDRYVLEAIRAMDEKKLQESVKRYRITMCGYGPVSAAIVYSKQVGPAEAEILSYYTSGDILKDNRAVVGYTAAEIKKVR